MFAIAGGVILGLIGFKVLAFVFSFVADEPKESFQLAAIGVIGLLVIGGLFLSFQKP